MLFWAQSNSALDWPSFRTFWDYVGVILTSKNGKWSSQWLPWEMSQTFGAPWPHHATSTTQLPPCIKNTQSNPNEWHPPHFCGMASSCNIWGSISGILVDGEAEPTVFPENFISEIIFRKHSPSCNVPELHGGHTRLCTGHLALWTHDVKPQEKPKYLINPWAFIIEIMTDQASTFIYRFVSFSTESVVYVLIESQVHI